MSEVIAYIERALTTPDPGYWPLYLAFAFIVICLCLFIWRRIVGNRLAPLEKALQSIAVERLSNIVIPKADDGEIHIDTVVLTHKGIVIVDVRDISGIVFGSDKMNDWTVMSRKRQYTMPNPQEGLLDRIAAVRLAAPNTPVDGRVVFGADADFSKGKPSLVCLETELASLFEAASELDAAANFRAGWDRLKDAALFSTGRVR